MATGNLPQLSYGPGLFLLPRWREPHGGLISKTFWSFKLLLWHENV